MPNTIQAVVLAGGTSERFQTNKTKLVEKICGKEMIIYPLQLLQKLHIPTSLVVGFQHERIQTVLQSHNIEIMHIFKQKQALGSGHAASLTQSIWDKENILLMGADTPLLTEDAITKLLEKHITTDADISFITAHGIDTENKNFCKVVINGNKIHVVDSADQTEDFDNQCCISGGVYIAKRSFLVKYIHQLTQNSNNNEYYLPELIQIASNNKCKIVTSPVSIDTIRSVDTLADLWAIEHIKRSEIIRYWMNNGVRISNALNVTIDEDVIIEPGVHIASGVHLVGKTRIKKNCTIGAYSYIENSTIEDECSIQQHVVLTNTTIAQNSTIKPFTYITNSETKDTQQSTTTFTGAIKTHHLDKQKDL